MKYRIRRDKTFGNGYYTYYDGKNENGCIYCGAIANTREHFPSKVLLNKPYPDNLFTLPACLKCNNGYSLDEEYLACFIEKLKEKVFKGYKMRDKIIDILNKKIKLNELIDEQIISDGELIILNVETDRFKKVIEKIAICHAGYEFDTITSCDTINTWFDFAVNLSNDQIKCFKESQISNVIPEIASRYSTEYCIVETNGSKDIFLMYNWEKIQKGIYEYCVFINYNGNVCVRLILSDFLYCEVIL